MVRIIRSPCDASHTKYSVDPLVSLVLFQASNELGGHMIGVHVEKLGEVAVVHCEGRVVQSDAVFQLRDAVMQQREASMVILDLSEVQSIGGGGLGMLVLLQQWTHDRSIQFKLIDPPSRVRKDLERIGSSAGFEIARMEEIQLLLGWGGPNSGLDFEMDRDLSGAGVTERNRAPH
jgi:anti-anti-sigma regulatory factor